MDFRQFRMKFQFEFWKTERKIDERSCYFDMVPECKRWWCEGTGCVDRPRYYEKKVVPRKIYLWLTSEDDSYGLVQDGWLDKTVKISHVPLYQGHMWIEIDDVTQYINQDSTCVLDSYYKSLAKTFASLDVTNYGSKSIKVPICVTFSLA